MKNLAIWGNHSATQFPDFANSTIGAKKTTDVISDQKWLEGEFITTVQKRGAAIIEARGLSLGRLGGQCGDRHGAQSGQSHAR